MTRVSKSIFTLEEKASELLYDYMSLVFLDKTIYKKKYSSCFSWLFCCECCDRGTQESAICYFGKSNTNDNDINKFIKWIIELSNRYLRLSNINTDKLTVNIIECIKTEDKILFENSNKATVIFHFNDNKNGYVTTHESNLNFTTDDRKYIVVTFR